jgi:hypothetical protein
MNSDILYLIEILALIGALFIRERQIAKERKDLLNRIMAKNLPEYKNMNDTGVPKAVENQIRKKMKERGGWVDAGKPQS